jgi:hypothetical protein
MRTMALVVTAVVVAGMAGSAGAQVVWLGAAGGASWTWERDRSALVRGEDPAVSLFIGIPLDRDALLRLRGAELSHADSNGATMRTFGLGVDYFFPGVVGEALVSAGVGSYRLHVPGAGAAESADGSWELGWYLGIGEWFSISRRTRLSVEVTWERTRHAGTPTMVAAMIGLAVSL